MAKQDEFIEAVDAFTAWEDGTPEPTVETSNGATTVSAVFRSRISSGDQLGHHLKDSVLMVLSGMSYDEFEAKGATYGDAAKALLAHRAFVVSA